MFLLGMSSVLLAAQAASSVAEAPADSPAMSAARANQARVKTKPAFKSGPDPVFSDEAKAAGETGQVMVAGILGADGRFSELQVVTSSRSERLDKAALDAAAGALFDPAKDESGTPIAIRAQMPFTFDNARTPGKGGGVLRYRCDQFVRDQDWWARTWPADRHELMYTMSLGIATLGRITRGINADDIRKGKQDFDKRWKAAVESCRAAPDSLFIDMLKPEGDAMRRLAKMEGGI